MPPSRLADDGRSAAVVIGLDCITGLQTARILVRRGVPVVGIAADPAHPCARTRVCERIIAGPTADSGLIATLEKLGPTLTSRAVLYPCTDAAVLVVARHRDRLEPWFHVVLPDTAILETLADKVTFAEHARRAGLPIPHTVLLNDRADAVRAASELKFPCIFKPASKSERWQKNSKTKVFRVATPERLIELYDRCSQWADAFVAQEWIEGSDSDLYSCNCYFDATGEPLVTFVARKLRQWPPRVGVSSLGEEVRNDVVQDLTLRLFRGVRFRGLGYLEVKRDSRTGEHYVIEANVGRPTGRSAIAEAGGVELLYTMYCDTLGLPLPTGLVQRYGGVKWIHWRQDLRSAFYYWRRGELSLGEWARSWRGKKVSAVFSWSDPRPFLADLASVARRL